MKNSVALNGFLLAPAIAFAGIYAPVPEQEVGRNIVAEIEGGILYDSNIFGAASGAEHSTVYSVSPRLKLNSPISDQTFVNGHYFLDVLSFSDRPGGEDTLYNHEFHGRLAHSFNETTELLISDTLSDIDNPESSLATGSLQVDQSFQQNDFDAKLNLGVNERFGLGLKYRWSAIDYEQAFLSLLLDRDTYQSGAEAKFFMGPEASVIGEVRYQANTYAFDGRESKDSTSIFYLGGFDRKLGPKSELTLRVGAEDRDHNAPAGGDDTQAYGDIGYYNEYAQGSFMSLGASFGTRESDAPDSYFGEETLSIYGSIQHALTAKTSISGSLTFEDASLDGRPGFSDIDESVTRVGLGLTYLPSPNWALILDYALDDRSSDVRAREEVRYRAGISVRYTFGL